MEDRSLLKTLNMHPDKWRGDDVSVGYRYEMYQYAAELIQGLRREIWSLREKNREKESRCKK